MTKEELIKFLEPFRDDIQILIYNEEFRFHEDGLSEIIPKYAICKNTNKKLGIYYQDGFIKLHKLVN